MGAAMHNYRHAKTYRLRSVVPFDMAPPQESDWRSNMMAPARMFATVVCKTSLLGLASKDDYCSATVIAYQSGGGTGGTRRLPEVLAAQSEPGIGAILVLGDLTEFGAIPGRAPAIHLLPSRGAARPPPRPFLEQSGFYANASAAAGPVRRFEGIALGSIDEAQAAQDEDKLFMRSMRLPCTMRGTE